MMDFLWRPWEEKTALAEDYNDSANLGKGDYKGEIHNRKSGEGLLLPCLHADPLIPSLCKTENRDIGEKNTVKTGEVF